MRAIQVEVPSGLGLPHLWLTTLILRKLAQVVALRAPHCANKCSFSEFPACLRMHQSLSVLAFSRLLPTNGPCGLCLQLGSCCTDKKSGRPEVASWNHQGGLKIADGLKKQAKSKILSKTAEHASEVTNILKKLCFPAHGSMHRRKLMKFACMHAAQACSSHSVRT